MWRNGRFIRAGAAISTVFMASAVLVTVPGTASADPVPGTRCIPPLDPPQRFVVSSEVTPVITHYLAFNVASGSSSERTDTLSVTNTVTTTYDFDAQISPSIAPVLSAVGLRVGFSVQTTTSSTITESSTMRWSFSQPGYYGLYKGTRRVDGVVRAYFCRHRLHDPRRAGTWTEPRLEQYTTYGYMEEGTVICSDTFPPGTVRAAARDQLQC
jgi:hypothetical protein